MRKFFDDLRALDVNDVGRWPLLFRGLAIGLIFVIATAAATYYTVVKQKLPVLEAAQQEEQKLRGAFELKQRKAANFEAYKSQLAEIEQSFGAMLRQLPGKTEVPSLLVDISQTGLAAGLQEELFRPQVEQVKEFYAELPIQIRVTGTYQELARFINDVAALPRIVTVHDISLKGRADLPQGDLVMDLTAKTYRYLEEGEEQS